MFPKRIVGKVSFYEIREDLRESSIDGKISGKSETKKKKSETSKRRLKRRCDQESHGPVCKTVKTQYIFEKQNLAH